MPSSLLPQNKVPRFKHVARAVGVGLFSAIILGGTAGYVVDWAIQRYERPAGVPLPTAPPPLLCGIQFTRDAEAESNDSSRKTNPYVLLMDTDRDRAEVEEVLVYGDSVVYVTRNLTLHLARFGEYVRRMNPQEERECGSYPCRRTMALEERVFFDSMYETCLQLEELVERGRQR